MIFQNKNETFDNFESKFFSFESALSSDNTNLVKNLSYPANPDQLQQIDSPYFQVENFITMSKQLNEDNFYNVHQNIRSLNVNIDNFR